ncbi:hypothetical protein B296_00041365 [Ensete ventricosum]|uniref:Uncharacterized protein n=1 Tax=Ensete ventricosum TaxID=4639 RepID=A0A426X2S3_ENSVE|nr:hypothetical protein B296_00041365 [Ensete ventricosum]
MRPPAPGCGPAAGMRLLPLAREAVACMAFSARGLCYTQLPLDAVAVNRSWQTRVRPSLDVAAAYASPIQHTVGHWQRG